MTSSTKYQIDHATILRLFKNAGISDITQVAPLGDGEFNAVYAARSPEREYVLKIAPPERAPVMAYERNMMEQEVFWYRVMREHTTIRVPEVYAADFSRTLLPVPYFIMERLPGAPLSKAHLNAAERAEAEILLARMTADMHRVRNAQFGYAQCGLHETWYAAIHATVIQMLGDCAQKKRRSRRGERLFQQIERHRATLEQVQGCMVNFDIWPANILVSHENGALQLSWIDPERSFWGDPMLDFVCFAFHQPLSSKEELIAAYNMATDVPVSLSRGELFRFAIGQGYLALIMETEKYYRYSPLRFGWWRNVLACRLLYRAAFAALEA